MFKPIFHAILRQAPESVQGALAYFYKPELRSSWGGPLNGQSHRQLVVQEIFRFFNPEYVLETGTFRGTTTEFFSTITNAKILSVESSAYLFGYAKARFWLNQKVTLFKGDSRAFLRDFLLDAHASRVFIYLDAHWDNDLPLLEEIDIVFSSTSSCVVMIDDFEVLDDAGYLYDDYGVGGALDVNYIRDVVDKWKLTGFYPSVSSMAESGAKRGSIVLANEPAVVRQLHSLDSLRAIQWPIAALSR